MNRVIVIGSRNWREASPIWNALDRVDPRVVLHGGEPGACAIAHEWCQARGRVAVVFFPDWEEGEKAAPVARNLKMLSAAKDALVLAFPLPLTESHAAWHCVTEARNRGMRVEVAGEQEVVDD